MVSVNDKQVYKNYMQYMFECHGCSIESTIVWMSKHYGETPQIFKAAKRELTAEQRNEIIREILGGSEC
ncbi:hypothetical protein ABM34_01385 [Companilactobacillus ginsenosidimutans]|uniref:Uncharacterized protein n=1 Tax=Companilactobacillus ginsenosidimutans TaxID=1007676 RepID=A0A0H4QDC3_9LACO|nr:hypothetical protein ABM34_01385 [Companilactobacillus ginsenosidimutans]